MIPFDRLSSDDAAALAWAAAAIAAAGPAACAAILWVQAWRGSPRFAPPRCSACAIELFPTEGGALAERCPECGHPTAERGQSTVRYAVRRWLWWRALATFAAGSVAFAVALLAAAGAGVGVGVLVRESGATARVEAIASTLQRHSSHRAVTDALRFAADGAPSDPMVREELRIVFDALLADEIPADRGLPLLLDRHDSEGARSLVVEALGSLRAAGAIDEPTLLAALARTAGMPAVRLRRDGDDLAIRFVLPDPALMASIESIGVDGDRGDGDRIGGTRPVPEAVAEGTASPDAERSSIWIARLPTREWPLPANAMLEIAWTIAWPARPLSDGATITEQPEGARLSIATRIAIPAEGVAVPEAERAAAPSTPFLARSLVPRILAESVGGMTVLSFRLRASLHPGWSLPGTWTLVAGDERVVLEGRATDDGYLVRGTGLLRRPRTGLPELFTLHYDPQPAASGDMTAGDGATGSGAVSEEQGLAPWPKAVRIEGLRWEPE